MPSVFQALSSWAQRGASSFAELLGGGTERPDAAAPVAGDLAYRLRTWPRLPPSSRKAPILRMLSVMSQRPVNRRWMQSQSGLTDAQLDRFIERLVAQDAVEVIDTSRFAR